MKNINTNRTRALIPLIHKSKRAILLSGTPALSRPLELFTQLHSLDPKNWADYKVCVYICVYTTITICATNNNNNYNNMHTVVYTSFWCVCY